MRRCLMFIAALCFSSAAAASLAQAQPAPAFGLSWDHCAGDGRIVDRTFSCDTNTGSEVLVGSITFRDGLRRTGIVALEGTVDLAATSSTLPSWWELDGCRSAPWFISFAPPPAGSSCADFWATSGGGSGGAHMNRTHSGPHPEDYEVVFVGACVDSVSLDSDREYQLFRLTILHAKTVGTNACAGCTVPVCLGLRSIKLVRPNDVGSEFILQASPASPASTVTWQSGYVASYTPQPPGDGQCICPPTGNLMCSTGPVPAHGSTWGQIKSLYR